MNGFKKIGLHLIWGLVLTQPLWALGEIADFLPGDPSKTIVRVTLQGVDPRLMSGFFLDGKKIEVEIRGNSARFTHKGKTYAVKLSGSGDHLEIKEITEGDEQKEQQEQQKQEEQQKQQKQEEQQKQQEQDDPMEGLSFPGQAGPAAMAVGVVAGSLSASSALAGVAAASAMASRKPGWWGWARDATLFYVHGVGLVSKETYLEQVVNRFVRRAEGNIFTAFAFNFILESFWAEFEQYHEREATAAEREIVVKLFSAKAQESRSAN